MTNDRAKREAFEKWCNMQQNEPQVATYAHEFMEQEWRAYQAGYKAARTFTQEDADVVAQVFVNAAYTEDSIEDWDIYYARGRDALNKIGEVK